MAQACPALLLTFPEAPVLSDSREDPAFFIFPFFFFFWSIARFNCKRAINYKSGKTPLVPTKDVAVPR